jgi:hypothetical protein
MTSHSPDLHRERHWRLLRQRGFIPGPHESETIFLRRVERSPILAGTPVAELNEFAIAPDWVDIARDSKELRFWEGAATLIEEDHEGIPQARILLGNSLFLTPEALMAHELVHAVRCAFPDSSVEEVMAWRTCPQRAMRPAVSLALDVTQLGAIFLVVQTILLGWILEEPLWWIGSAISLCVTMLRAAQAIAPVRRAIQQLEGRDLPAWPILLHLTAEEIQCLGTSFEGFWEEFRQASHFRFEFMQATFAMLRSK